MRHATSDPAAARIGARFASCELFVTYSDWVWPNCDWARLVSRFGKRCKWLINKPRNSALTAYEPGGRGFKSCRARQNKR